MIEINIEISTDDSNLYLGNMYQVLEMIVNDHGFENGFLNVVVIRDNLMKSLHENYLNDPTTTDVMSFEFEIEPERKHFEGEVYANIDQVRRQAKEYSVSYENELARVIFHGTLHLVGYDDKTEEQRKLMREKEDYYLSKYY